MKKYMILNNTYSVENGKYDATIFNFETCSFFSINGERNKLFKKWIKGSPIEFDDLSEEGKNFYNFLLDNNIATFSDKFYINEQFNVGKKLTLYNENVCKLSRIFIELGEDNTSIKKNITSSCWLCLSETPVKIYDPELYVKLIEKIAADGGDQIILYGGNVIAAPETEKLMQAADDSYIQLCINVNSKTLTDEEIKRADDNNTIIVVTFDFSEKIDFDFFKSTFERIENIGAQAKYSFVISNDTVDEYRSFEAKAEELGVDIVNVSMIVGSSITEDELSEICMPKNINFNEYKVYKSINPCMAGTLAIDHNMNIIPCPAMKQHPLGKVVFDDEVELVRDFTAHHLSDFWLSQKKLISNCSECSRKHLCMDCRALELAVDKNENGNYVKRECIYMDKCRKSFEIA